MTDNKPEEYNEDFDKNRGFQARISLQNDMSIALEQLINSFRAKGITYADVLGVLEMSKASLCREALDMLEAECIQKAHEEHQEVEDAEPLTDEEILHPEDNEQDNEGTEYFDQQ